jgi:hypothetical protein
VKALLRELIAWRRRRSFRTTFTTEASLNVVDDPELLSLMVQAGFKRLFVGIESPDDESLAECAKVQNHGRDMVSAVRTIQNAGMEVMGGFIVGFDSDTPSIFERQKRFIQEAGVVTAMVGLLTALPGTRLFKRLMQEGRIVQHSTGNNVDAVLNFVPRLERRSLIEGYRSLVKHLYMPSLYYSRILTFLRAYRPSGPKTRIYGREVRAFLASLWVLGVRTRGADRILAVFRTGGAVSSTGVWGSDGTGDRGASFSAGGGGVVNGRRDQGIENEVRRQLSRQCEISFALKAVPHSGQRREVLSRRSKPHSMQTGRLDSFS